jgi:hypothetical protein
MSRRFRYRDEDSSTTTTVLAGLAGALAGFAVGVLVADRLGGLSGIRDQLRRRTGRMADTAGTAPEFLSDGYEDFDEFEDDELEEDNEQGDSQLEYRVLEAFRNDPILAERAVDIGSISQGIIELSGWVETEDESQHAVTLTRGVPGVDTVVNRLAVGTEESLLDDNARRVAEGDPALTEARWDGTIVGTGRRRQGTSSEMDRHADPRVHLEERWSSTEEAIRNAADDIEGTTEPRGRKPRGGTSRDAGATDAPGA